MVPAAPPGARGQLGRIVRLIRRDWSSARSVCAILMIGTVLPAVPGAAEIALVGVAFAQRVGRGGDFLGSLSVPSAVAEVPGGRVGSVSCGRPDGGLCPLLPGSAGGSRLGRPARLPVSDHFVRLG
jgi:hypothetical protein